MRKKGNCDRKLFAGQHLRYFSTHEHSIGIRNGNYGIGEHPLSIGTTSTFNFIEDVRISNSFRTMCDSK